VNDNRRNIFAVAILAASVVIIVLALVFSLYQKQAEEAANSDFAKVSDNIPLGTYTDIDGNSVSLRLDGRPMVVLSFASWCPQCKDHLHMLSRLKNIYGERIDVVALDRKESAEHIRDYLAFVGETPGVTIYIDHTDHLFSATEGYAMPEILMFREDGSTLFHGRGSMMFEELSAALDAHFSE
jgi:thiol-disulfide isomerase/thioredoxin